MQLEFLSGEKAGRKIQNNNENISLFEVVPRQSSNLYDKEENNDNTVDLLPIKAAHGIIKRKGERAQQGKFSNI